MPPTFALTLGLAGAAILVRWCVREVQRVNAELERARTRSGLDGVDRAALPTLKRDPRTGEYRPG